MSVSNYRDYLWAETSGFDDYCVTLIGTSTPDGVLADLKARREQIVARGMSDALFEGRDLGDDHDVNGVDRQIVAVADIGDGWTLMVQMPGFIGISDAMQTLRSGHEIVSHQAGMAGGRFEWWSKGTRQISFEPLLPSEDLVGRLADRQPEEARTRIVNLVTEVGGIDLDETPGREFHYIAGSFALSERLTGVRITPELLNDSTFTVAVVPLDAATDHDPAMDSPVVPLLGEPPSWSEMVRLHEASVKLTVHGTMRMTSSHPQPGDDVVIEFWRKHRSAWRFADAEGSFAITGRRGHLWFREDGVLTDEWQTPVTTNVHPPFLIEFGKHLWNADLPSAVPETTRGSAAEVAGRAAWEFEIDDAGQRSQVALDAQTGVALRWKRGGGSYELTDVEIGVPLEDALFVGP